MNMSPSPMPGRSSQSEMIERMTLAMAPVCQIIWRPSVTMEPSERYRPVLKSLASVTTGEPETFFSVFDCSQVMESSLCLMTSNRMGSISFFATRRVSPLRAQSAH